MNIIEIRGGRKDQRDVAEKVIDFMVQRLGLGRVRTLDIDFAIKKNLVKNTGAEAFHMEGETHCDHEIEIDADLGFRDFVTAICHEMVHLKQCYRKELVQKNGKMFWKGRDCTDVDYMNQPWEKEAYKLQDKLALDVWKEVL